MEALILIMIICTGIIGIGTFVYPFIIWSTMPDCFEEFEKGDLND